MNNKPEVIRIMLDFMQGPIWISDSETGEPLTGIDVIDSDSIIKELNYKCSELYSGYFEFDSHDMPCFFNKEKEKQDKYIMLDLITRLIDRLNEINDGSYVVEDCETERLKNL